MLKLKHLFSSNFERLSRTIERFYLSFGFIVALFFVTSYLTTADLDRTTFKNILKIEFAIVFGIFICVLSKILYEKYFKDKFNNVLFDFITLFFVAIPYALIHICDRKNFLMLCVYGVIISGLIFILYFSGIGPMANMSKIFSYFSKCISFNFFVCTIISIGIFVCVFAFESLIYKFKDSYKVYVVLGEFIWIVLFGVMFLSTVPKLDQKITTPKIFKIIVYKIMLPVYLLLLSILYIYFVKILFTLTFPSGQINWFVSFVSIFFVFFTFSLSQYRNEYKALNLFLKFGGLVVVPTIAMQFVAIYIRVSNYGLTTLRYSSIILNIFVLTFIIMFLISGEMSLRRALLVLSGFVLFSTVTPFNVFDVPMVEQSYRLKKLLSNNNMLVNNCIVHNSNIVLEEKDKIIESYRYVKNNFEYSNYNPKFLNKDLINKSEKDIFGFEKTYGYRSNDYYHSTVSFTYDYRHIDISGYSKLYNISNKDLKIEDNKILISKNNEKYIIEGLYDYLKNMHSEYKKLGENKVTNKKLEYEFGNKKIILSNVKMYLNEKNKFGIDLYAGCYLLESA